MSESNEIVICRDTRTCLRFLISGKVAVDLEIRFIQAAWLCECCPDFYINCNFLIFGETHECIDNTRHQRISIPFSCPDNQKRGNACSRKKYGEGTKALILTPILN